MLIDGPPVTLTSIANQKLKEMVLQELTNRAMTLGSTPTGADWCLKALHPSDPLVEVRGLPDKSSVPSAFVNYQAVFTISPQAGATGTWTLDASLIPDPIGMMSFSATDSVGAVNSMGLNPQLSGATYLAKFTTFTDAVQRWRLAYASVTATQDGPDLANQGTVVVAQKVCLPKVLYLGTLNGAQAVVGPKTTFFTDEDFPNYSNAQALPNAYYNASKFGYYAPLKLTRTCQRWRDLWQDVSIPLGQSATLSGALSYILPGATSASTVWPYYGLNQAAWAAAGGTAGDRILDWGNDVCVQSSFRNMAVTTSVTFFVRFGIEISVSAASIYSPQLRLSPPHDSKALKTYFAIAREMKDAYPADYNDLAKLWSTIKNILRKVAPIVSMIPHPIAQAVGAAVPAGLDLIEGVEKSFKSPANGRGGPSAGAVEAARAKL